MAVIGSVECTFLRGTGASPTPRIEVFQRPGVDGYGAQHLGSGHSEATFTAVWLGAASGLASWLDSLWALAGTVQTITDDWGLTWVNCFIVSMEQPVLQAARFAETPDTPGVRAEVAVHVITGARGTPEEPG